MGVAALILGIISIIVGFIPLCGAIAYFPAIIGLILGIIDIVLKTKKKEPRGMAIAGTVLTAISLIIITFWLFVFGVAFSDQTLQQEINNQLQDNMEDYDWNI